MKMTGGYNMANDAYYAVNKLIYSKIVLILFVNYTFMKIALVSICIRYDYIQ